MLLVRERGRLAEAFAEDASYLFQAETTWDSGQRSLQCGRRNATFGLWAAWRVHGDAGWAERIERQRRLAEHAAARVAREPALRVAAEPSLLNVCFEVTGRCSAAICAALDRSGAGCVGWAVVDGRRIIRLVTLHADLDTGDVDALLDAVLAAARDAPESDNRVD